MAMPTPVSTAFEIAAEVRAGRLRAVDVLDAHLANVAAGLVVAKLGTATLTRAELAAAL